MNTECFFPVDHPAASGHFPGNPIIPGAVLLEEALKAIEASLGERLLPCRIRSAKFLSPVRPGERVAIQFDRVSSGDIRFTVAVDGRQVLRGEAACGTRTAG